MYIKVNIVLIIIIIIMDLKEDKVYTVSEINNIIKDVLKHIFDQQIVVTGEISNIKYSKDNIYFTLKDSQSLLSVVIWNYSKKNHKFVIKNGDDVHIYGSVTTHHKLGTYQLTGTNVELKGVGDLHQQYQLLKLKYEALGYFENKKPEPTTVKNVGVATAVDGAALKDFLYVLGKNKFLGRVYVYNCAVQGKDCPPSVVNAMNMLDKMNLDVILVMRGGGSFEDLFGFSDSAVLECVKKLKSYTISAVGHEVDHMLVDSVADLRAPTPSLAGEQLCRLQHSTLNFMKNNFLENCYLKIIQRLQNNKIFLQSCEKKIQSAKQQFRSQYYKIIDRTASLKLSIKNILDSYSTQLNSLRNRLLTMNPNIILEKGYCMMVIDKTKTVDSVATFISVCDKSKKLKLIFKDGSVVIDTKKLYICEWKNEP